MAWGVLASSPSRRDGVITPTRNPDGSRSRWPRLENKNPRSVFRRRVDRLPPWRHPPNPRNLALYANSHPTTWFFYVSSNSKQRT
jgi:hypothetical protein